MRQVWKVCASRSEARAKGVGASLRNGIPDWTIPRTAPPQRSCMCAGPAPPRRAMAAPARSSGFRERERAVAERFIRGERGADAHAYKQRTTRPRRFLLPLPPLSPPSPNHAQSHPSPAAMARTTPFGLAVAAALVFAVAMPALAAAQAPAPAPTSDGESIIWQQ